MTRTSALLVLAWLSAGCTDPTTQGTPAKSEEQDIVGGAPTSAFPAVGALTIHGQTTCTGTLVAPRKVLTAAHCLVHETPDRMSFTIGARIDEPEEEIPAETFVIHGAYDDATLANDIAYVVLKREPRRAQPMKIVASMTGDYVGRELSFVGYGDDDGYARSGSGIKRYVNIPVTRVRTTTFEYDAVDGKNTCRGDSGGPALAQLGEETFVVGVTSSGDDFCVENGVNTRVDVYADFLGLGEVLPEAPCGGETHQGRCSGNTLVWCENEQVRVQDCSPTGHLCGFYVNDQVFACVPPATDPCQGETVTGRCAGDTVVFCENAAVKQLHCPTGCAYDASKGYTDCK